MTADEPLNLLTASQAVCHAANGAFEDFLRAAEPGPAPGSAAASDAEWNDPGWGPAIGSGPLAIASLLLSGANAVLLDLGDLVGAARGPVTAPTLCRYILEHVAELHWILSPGSHQDGTDPTPSLSPEEHNERYLQAQAMRVKRAALRTYGWTVSFENGRRRPAENEERGPGLPPRSPAELEAILEPHGLMPKNGRLPPSQMDPAKKAMSSWRIGEDVVDVSATQKINELAVRFIGEGSPQHASVYAFFSTSTHPNPFAISEVRGDSGRFERPASEMAFLVTYAAGAFALGLETVTGYAGWDPTAARTVTSLVGQLSDCAEEGAHRRPASPGAAEAD